jgi:hypothetical protein
MWTKGRAETCEMKVPFISVYKCAPREHKNNRAHNHTFLLLDVAICRRLLTKLAINVFFFFSVNLVLEVTFSTGSYLQDRRQQTTILGATSSPSQVTSGVPQGSI